ncbi:uncharacterized protein DUF2393 [Edaphobacter aggregans]|uniref:Uncharacterized protein DUF2393 n=1 Tax=Edaphobacter aggregans TaxID=570835 RepID=A0A428MLM3_9BACT|nr:DUF2393 domain-containing protein [Edaphobacter aggregans]RSL17828.1 uncharacterized protein DUF2393 [Edaphobacter aggregans]
MSELGRQDGREIGGKSEPVDIQQAGNEAGIFAPKAAAESRMPVSVWIIAGLAVLAVVVGLVFAGRKKTEAAPNTVLPLAAYAGNLPLSQLAMSESTSLSGGKSTFVDGYIKNTGSETVTGVTVQVIFRNDEAMPPQLETVPLALIRTREPYVDTQMVSAAPLKPGDEREFRLIFESIPTNWNYQMPEVHVVRVDTK